MKTEFEQVASITQQMSEIIQSALRSHEMVRHYPDGSSPDRMDDKIKQTGERVATLRRLREEFENEMARPV